MDASFKNTKSGTPFVLVESRLNLDCIMIQVEANGMVESILTSDSKVVSSVVWSLRLEQLDVFVSAIEKTLSE